MSMRTFDKWMLADIVHPPGAYATGILPSSYIDMSDYDRIVFLIMVGTLGATDTLDAQVVQATDAAGAGSKNVTGAVITQLVDADDDNMVSIEVAGSALDVENGFRYVALSIAQAGTPDGAVLALRYRGGGLPPTQPAAYSEQVRAS